MSDIEWHKDEYGDFVCYYGPATLRVSSFYNDREDYTRWTCYILLPPFRFNPTNPEFRIEHTSEEGAKRLGIAYVDMYCRQLADLVAFGRQTEAQFP